MLPDAIMTLKTIQLRGDDARYSRTALPFLAFTRAKQRKADKLCTVNSHLLVAITRILLPAAGKQSLSCFASSVEAC